MGMLRPRDIDPWNKICGWHCVATRATLSGGDDVNFPSAFVRLDGYGVAVVSAHLGSWPTMLRRLLETAYGTLSPTCQRKEPRGPARAC